MDRVAKLCRLLPQQKIEFSVRHATVACVEQVGVVLNALDLRRLYIAARVQQIFVCFYLDGRDHLNDGGSAFDFAVVTSVNEQLRRRLNIAGLREYLLDRSLLLFILGDIVVDDCDACPRVRATKRLSSLCVSQLDKKVLVVFGGVIV